MSNLERTDDQKIGHRGADAAHGLGEPWTASTGPATRCHTSAVWPMSQRLGCLWYNGVGVDLEPPRAPLSYNSTSPKSFLPISKSLCMSPKAAYKTRVTALSGWIWVPEVDVQPGGGLSRLEPS